MKILKLLEKDIDPIVLIQILEPAVDVDLHLCICRRGLKMA